MRYFSRRHRCITYSARGYTPSDVPASADAYTYEHFARDVVAVLDHLGIARAHVVGLSMGGYSTLQVGLRHPARALSLTLAGTGSGSERWSPRSSARPAARPPPRWRGRRRGAENLRPGPNPHPVPGQGPARPSGIRRRARASRHQGVGQYAARLSGRPAADLRFRGRHPPHRAADADRRAATRTILASSRACSSRSTSQRRGSRCSRRPATP